MWFILELNDRPPKEQRVKGVKKEKNVVQTSHDKCLLCMCCLRCFTQLLVWHQRNTYEGILKFCRIYIPSTTKIAIERQWGALTSELSNLCQVDLSSIMLPDPQDLKRIINHRWENKCKASSLRVPDFLIGPQFFVKPHSYFIFSLNWISLF